MSKGTKTANHFHPDCDMCKPRKEPAKYDAYLPSIGCWGNVCEMHFTESNARLGVGLGQELVEPESLPTPPLSADVVDNLLVEGWPYTGF